MPGLRSWKTSCKSKSRKMGTKFPLKTVYFQGVSRLTTSFYTVYVYNTSGHMDLYSIFVLYIQYTVYTFLYSIHIFLCNIFIYLYCNKNVRDSHV
jgi:hypothetical protein